MKTGEAAEILRQLAPDLAVVVAFGKILPKEVLEIPPLGCIKSFPHRLQVFLIQDYVEGKIGLYAILTANPADLGEVLRREIVC